MTFVGSFARELPEELPEVPELQVRRLDVPGRPRAGLCVACYLAGVALGLFVERAKAAGVPPAGYGVFLLLSTAVLGGLALRRRCAVL